MPTTRFIMHMIFLMMLMLVVSIAIKANYYSQMVIWLLFVYIIAKEVIHEMRCEKMRKQWREQEREIGEVIRKLNRLNDDIKGTV